MRRRARADAAPIDGDDSQDVAAGRNDAGQLALGGHERPRCRTGHHHYVRRRRSAGWAWLRTVSGTSLSLTSHLRVGAAIALVVLAFALGRKGRWRLLVGKTVNALLGLLGS